MNDLSHHLRRLASMAVLLFPSACGDSSVTAPATGPLAGSPQFSSHASGGQLFGATGSTLYMIDANTGEATPVGGPGFDGVIGIDFAPDGTLYGITDASGTIDLITIDITTGAGTFVQALAPGFTRLFDVSFRRNDPTLYMTRRNGSRVGGVVGLATVNVGTGLPVDVGPIKACETTAGLAFSDADVLYYAEVSGGVGTLYSLARTTGSPSTTASLSPAGFPAGTQLSRVAGMDFDPGALVLYASLQGSIRGGSGKRAVATFLATVNPGTGVVTHVGLTKQGLVGLAVEPSAALPIVTTTLVPIESKSLKHNKGHFEVEFTYDDGTTTAALNGIPVDNLQIVDLRLKSSKSDKSDKSAKSEKSKKSGKSNKPGKPVKIAGGSFELVVTCTNDAGSATETATAVSPEKSKKSKKG